MFMYSIKITAPLICHDNFYVFHSIDRTVKMYIGGAQKRPDATYVRPVLSASGQVSEPSR